MDKTALGFLADVLYIKGLIYFDEFEAIMEASTPQDLGEIVEKMLRGEYTGHRKGEPYVDYTN